MRTTQFSESGLSEEGKKKVQLLASLSEGNVSKLVEWFKGRDRYPRFDAADVGEVAEKLGQSGESASDTLSIVKFFIDKIIDYDEPASYFVEDLRELKILDNVEGYNSLDKFFSKMMPVIEKFRFYRRCRLTEDYGQPTLIGSSMSAVMKPVHSKNFKYGKDDIASYKPRIIGHTIVAQIELEQSSRSETFTFQMNEDNFDRFITGLLALQAEMKQLRESLKC